jgi:hypothetical protein
LLVEALALGFVLTGVEHSLKGFGDAGKDALLDFDEGQHLIQPEGLQLNEPLEVVLDLLIGEELQIIFALHEVLFGVAELGL